MEALGRFVAVRPDGSGAAATWFNLGDADLATHLYRTHRRREGATLSDGHRRDQRRPSGLAVRLLPMSDDRVETRVAVDGEGEIGFQEYFVGRHHDVAITGVRFDGVEQARPAPGVLDALRGRRRRGHRPVEPDRVDRPGRGGARRPSGRSRPGGTSVVAVSPIVGGAALKGPADRMLRELGGEASVAEVARRYRDVAGTLVIDAVDEARVASVEAEGLRCLVTVDGDEHPRGRGAAGPRHDRRRIGPVVSRLEIWARGGHRRDPARRRPRRPHRRRLRRRRPTARCSTATSWW